MNISTHNSREITRIGHYEILDCIGHGGMGLVYRARDTRLDRQVAIKCLRAELFEKHYRERFRREALLLAKLNHPHIVQIYDYLETDEQLALVMEYVDGQNLQIRLREQIVPLKQRMQWLVQIAQGLAVAHDAGIIHRDLKTENILINKHNIAKISDLGIAKSQDFNATLTDHVAGSYCSMSPEQAMGEELDFKSDLFSLGILAYQLLCGSHPFGATDNKLQLMQRIISHPPIPPAKCNPDLPPEIGTLLGQLLSKNIDKRPDNTHWVAAQFDKLSHQLTAHSWESNDTQLLAGKHSYHNDGSKSGSRIAKMKNAEHPTFTDHGSYAKNAPLSGFRSKGYKSVFAAIALIFVMATGIGVWQLQPEQPKYIAVIPPILTAEGMQESQQELVKSAVYDAIQQSVIQLQDYYLISRIEVEEVNGDNETVHRATAADELITTEIHCKIEACTIHLSRLVPENETTAGRLRVEKTKTIDVLTANYLSVAEAVQSIISSAYATTVDNSLSEVNPQDYSEFIKISLEYRTKGESELLLTKLENLESKTRNLAAVQTLFCEIALDLYHETKNKIYLEKATRMNSEDPQGKANLSNLRNRFYIKVALQEYKEAALILDQMGALISSRALLKEMQAYLMSAQKDYKKAIAIYQEALSLKPTANTLYRLALANWHIGQTDEAQDYINRATELSPEFYHAQSLRGTLALLNGEVSLAIQSFEKNHEKTPLDTLNLSNLGLSYLLNNQDEKALQVFEKASGLAPKNTAFTLNKADTLNIMGRSEDAGRAYQEIIDAHNDAANNADLLNHLSQAFAHIGRIDDALAALKQLEAIDPQSVKTAYTAAIVHTLASNNASAIFSIKNALQGGVNSIWFSFPWFDRLCSEPGFMKLMGKHGEHKRCPPFNRN